MAEEKTYKYDPYALVSEDEMKERLGNFEQLRLQAKGGVPLPVIFSMRYDFVARNTEVPLPGGEVINAKSVKLEDEDQGFGVLSIQGAYVGTQGGCFQAVAPLVFSAGHTPEELQAAIRDGVASMMAQLSKPEGNPKLS